MTRSGKPPISARDLDRRITFEVNDTVKDPRLNTVRKGNWAAIAGTATVWAQVRGAMPSRGETQEDGLEVARRPARIRLRWRDDIESRMRIILWRGTESIGETEGVIERIMQIVAGPEEIFADQLGRRTWMELMAVEYSSGEQAA
jgi:head-tail adaptor